MQNIFLVRHGESLGNVDLAVYKTTPDHAIPLSELGRRQAKAAGVALSQMIDIGPTEPLRIWTSPYRRTRETADMLEGELRPHEWFDRQRNPGNCDIYRIDTRISGEGGYVYRTPAAMT
jgi:broad specificity phosphatase PhoE